MKHLLADKDPWIVKRAAALYAGEIDRTRRFTDRMFACLMAAQFVFGVMVALIVSPRTWLGAESHTHIHVWAGLALGGIIASAPIVLAVTRPGAAITRHVIAAAQMLFSALLIHLMGGRIEAHFHVFGSLAFLAFYRDWRVLVTATVVVASDHFIRGVFWPQSVFGVLTASPFRWMEHAAWVVFEDVFLLVACSRGVRDARALATRMSELESARAHVEEQVAERTTELADARAEAEDANAAKSQFLAQMSHELRSPLTAIIGYSEFLREDGPDAHLRLDAIKTVDRNAKHLLGVINDVLDLSKIEAGKIEIERARCSPVQIVEDIASMARAGALNKGVRFELEVEMPAPRWITSDPLRLRQVILNIVSNAVKFTEKGEVGLRVRFVPDGGEGGELIFEIRDSGVGMSPDQVGLIFNPFTQADSSVSRRYGGTGLGLAIARNLTEMLGGRIDVTSELGRGSVFTVTLDVHEPGLEMIASIEDAVISREASREPLPTLDADVLLAEDGPDNQRLITMLLTRAGARVEIVGNGEACVEAALARHAEAHPFDLILMDMQMPVLDGYGAARRLRARGYTGAVVALTAHAMSGDRARCLSAGCDEYLTKPIDRAKLIKTCALWAGAAREGSLGSLRARDAA